MHMICYPMRFLGLVERFVDRLPHASELTQVMCVLDLDRGTGLTSMLLAKE